MGLINLSKYLLRFLLLQSLVTITTIWYFDKFLIGEYVSGYDIIIRNLLEDRARFYEFIPYNFVKIDVYLALFVFTFLIILYSTNFYSYANDLVLTTNKGFLMSFYQFILYGLPHTLAFYRF